jgi:hypothetical protein
MISSDTDIKIFIDAHKSSNSFLPKEEFVPYDIDSEEPRGPKKESLIDKIKNNVARASNGEFEGVSLINDNYIQ